MLLFLGHTGSGKSTTINALTGSKLPVSDSLEPCTSEVLTAHGTIHEHSIECIDTPGFGDRTHSDVEVLRMVEHRLMDDFNERKRVHAIFYTINLDVGKIDRSIATDLEVFFGLVGIGGDTDDVWKNVCFIFTHGEDPASGTGKGRRRKLEVQEKRKSEWAERLSPAIDRGAQIHHVILGDEEETEEFNEDGMQTHP